MRLRKIVFLIVFSLLAFVPVDGQSPNGTISGIVADPSGATVPGADILIANDATGVQYPAKTNSEGLYVVPNLPPGSYRLQVSKIGFKTIIKPDIVIHVQDALAINFTLPIGAASEVVTVQGGAPLVNTENAAVSTVIDRNFAERLPLNGRSFNTLLQLTPGVTITTASNASPGQFTVNGQRTNANYVQVDGASANFGVVSGAVQNQGGGGGVQAFNAYGGTSSLVSVDAMQEFRVETSSFAPEFGRTPGGQVIISTRSGSNRFHGSVSDYFRNDGLDANDWFANRARKPRAPERQNDFGGVLGGPIIRDRTFFFFSYEGLRLRQPQTVVVQVPTVSLRTSAVPTAQPILNAYPLPDNSSTTGNAAPFTGSYSNPVTMNAASLRADHTFGNRLSVFGRYSWSPSQLVGRGDNLATIQAVPTDTKTLTIGMNNQLSRSITNTFRFNYSTQQASNSFRLDSFGGATPLGPTALLPASLAPKNNEAFFDDFVHDPIDFGHESANKVMQLNLLDDPSFTIGAHQMKFGIDFRRLVLDQTGGSHINYLAFGVTNFANSGKVDFVINPELRPAKTSFRSFSTYAQDTWRAGHRLTLTYGLRWEVNPTPTGLDGTVLASWRNIDNPAATTLALVGTPPWQTTYGNIAPRVGLAYRVTSNGSLVVRGGWGIFYDLGTGTAAVLGASFPSSSTIFLFPSNGPYPVPIDAASITSAFSLQPPFAGIVSGFDPNLKLPYSHEWNVAVERSLWNKQSLSVTYLGQVGRRLLREEAEAAPNQNFTGPQFTLTRNGDTSDYHALQVQFRRPMARRVQALLQYTWSHSIDDNSDDSGPVNAGALLNPRNDRGSSNFDVRQNLTGAFSYDIPAFKHNAAVSGLTGGWSLDGVVNARAGFPVRIGTFSVNIPGTAGGASTRPDLVPGQPVWLYGSQFPGGRALNPAAFALPSTPRQGTLGRNAFAGFGATQLDVSLGRRFGITDKLNLQFRADTFNLLNHPNFANPSGAFPSPAFGLSNRMLNVGLGGLSPLYQIGGPRSIQLSLKLSF